MSAGEWSLLIILSVLWGGSFFFAKLAVGELPPLTLVLLRVAIAALVLVAFLHAVGHNLPSRLADWWPLAVMGLLNNVIPFGLFFWGMKEIDSGLAAIINATTPLFAVILAHWLTRDERLTPGKLAGILLGISGVVLLIGLDAIEGAGRSVLAQLACLLAAFSYALSGIWGRRFSGQMPVKTAAGQLVASTLIMLPLVLLIDRPWALPMPSAAGWAAVLGLAIVSTALAYVIFFRILRTAGATNLLLVTLLIPVSALVLGSAILGERIGAEAIAGMSLIGLGLAAIDGRLLKILAAPFCARRDGIRRRAP